MSIADNCSPCTEGEVDSERKSYADVALSVRSVSSNSSESNVTHQLSILNRCVGLGYRVWDL